MGVCVQERLGLGLGGLKNTDGRHHCQAGELRGQWEFSCAVMLIMLLSNGTSRERGRDSYKRCSATHPQLASEVGICSSNRLPTATCITHRASPELHCLLGAVCCSSNRQPPLCCANANYSLVAGAINAHSYAGSQRVPLHKIVPKLSFPYRGELQREMDYRMEQYGILLSQSASSLQNMDIEDSRRNT
jgi:hypothetical protein